MRVLLATVGSDGDVLPFLALAQRLIAEGHQVRLATNTWYATRAAKHDVPFVGLGPEWDQARTRDLFTRVLAERRPLTQLVRVVEAVVDEQLAARPHVAALVREVDVVIYAPLFVGAVAAARAAGTMHVSAHLAPLHRASTYGPTGADLGWPLNRMMWSVAAAMLRRATDARLNAIVEASGLPPWRDVLLESSHSGALDLIAVSPRVLPRDPTWGAATRVTGYWYLDEPAFVPDATLARFVAEEPPVVIGFGSMMNDATAFTAQIAEAARDLGRRVVVQAGWSGLGGDGLPENVHVTGFVPHAWLFARAACVLHHGGAGTTAAAMRAGVPQAIAWHLGDQPVWGHKVAKLGIGPKPCAHFRADARWMRKVIARMLDDAEMRARAAALGVAVRAEDGVGAAVAAITEVTARGPA